MSGFRPVKILGVIQDEVTEPRNDDSPGGALYAVPFRFSCQPESEWAALFIRLWGQPSQDASAPRSPIAIINGDKLILDGTTMEEVETTHQITLKAVLDDTNRRFPQESATQQADDAAQRDHERK